MADPTPAVRSRGRFPAALLAAVLTLPAAPAGQEGPFDDDLRTAAPPAYALEPQLLRLSFLDLFGRPPLEDERRKWAGKGLRELLDDQLGGPEFWAHWYEEQLYYFLLIDNFRPRSERVQAVPADLTAGKLGVRDAVHRVVLSSSFDQRNPGADTFVTVVMEQLLGVTVQKDVRNLDIGKALYDGKPGLFLGQQGNSQADVVRIAMEDKRFLRQFLEREYRRLLRAEPERRDLAEWARELDRNPMAYAGLVKDWMLSEAYQRRLETPRPQPNRMFIRSLFVDLLDRFPDEDEARRMRDALDCLSDPGPLRSVLARLLLDSGQVRLPDRAAIEDPTSWVAGLFRRLLGREATQEELASFVGAFHEPECRPATVVYALVSHPEYHHY